MQPVTLVPLTITEITAAETRFVHIPCTLILSAAEWHILFYNLVWCVAVEERIRCVMYESLNW